MAFLVVLLNVGAVVASGGHGLAIVSLIGAIWSWGVVSNFRHDPENIPGYTMLLSLVAAAVGIITLIVGVTS